MQKIKKSFTLTEIIIAVVIVGLIATVAIPLYNNIVEKAKAKTCEANLRVLLGALETFSLENDALPGSLSQIPEKTIMTAWSKLLKEQGYWKIKLAYYIVDFDQQGLAYAQDAWVQRYLGSLNALTCPANTSGGISYGLNSRFANVSRAQYLSSREGSIIIADSDTSTFTEPPSARRHKKFIFPSGVIRYAIGISIVNGQAVVWTGVPAATPDRSPGCR